MKFNLLAIIGLKFEIEANSLEEAIEDLKNGLKSQITSNYPGVEGSNLCIIILEVEE